ncbi:metalloregulator ArsR/SmtB family transcription factor [Eubacterium sp. MSJ-13]|nr:metalloregulator ArsR/SmtB family transcription factor [Eubacterium sp. MSJ-13]
MHTKKDIDKLTADFSQCQKILLALGDENRQHMILEMMKIGNCNGVRVNEIAEKTHLSRPAVSHHLQILKNAGILKMRRESTKNYYYFDPDMKSFELLISVLQTAVSITSELPDRSNSDEDIHDGQ